MKRNTAFMPHLFLLTFLIKVRVIRASNYNSSKTPSATGNIIGLLLQCSSALILGWLMANWIADHGYRGASEVYSHSDWALQGRSLGLNVALFFSLLLTLVLKFSLWVRASFQSAFRLQAGFAALMSLWVISQAITYYLSPKLNYDLWLDTPYAFTVVWQTLSCMTFLGVDNLLRSIRNSRDDSDAQH